MNRIVQPTLDEIVLTVFTGKRTEKLYISASPSNPRVTVGDSEKEAPLTAPNFCMLLRKHLLSATINNISLVEFDRIVKIDFTASSEFFDAGERTLYVELMGRYSNVILTQDGKVLGANRGINFLDNGVRPLIVGREYVFPPNNEKKLPKDESLASYFIDNDSLALENIICDNVQGVARATAKEIVNAYFENNAEFSSQKFYEFFREFVYESKLSPCIIKENGIIKDVCVFPYKTLSGEIESFETLIKAENFYFSKRSEEKEFRLGKERLFSILSSAVKKVKKRYGAIIAREKDATSANENKLKGDLILSNIYLIKQGDKECVLTDYETGNEIKIELDISLTPSKNAERYYKKYNKQKRALEALAVQKQTAESELSYLESVTDNLSLAETVEDLTLINEELIETGLVKVQRQAKPKKVKESVGRIYDIKGFTVKVGRNNKENDQITFSARQGDLWLHSKLYHSSHAIIESAGKKIPESVIVTTAEIVAYYSKGRSGGKTEVVVTDRKFVKKPNGAKLGFCTYSNFQSVSVSPSARLEFLKTR